MRRNFLQLIGFFFLAALLTVTLPAKGQNDGNNGDKKFNRSSVETYAALSGSESSSEAPLQEDDGTILKKESIRIINLGVAGVNSERLDYAPTISADGRTLYFVSDREGSKYNPEAGVNSHDFWAVKKAERLDTNFFEPYNIDTTTNLGNVGVNTPFNEGAASIAADRQSLYFTGCNRPDGLGSCDIYKTEIQGDQWGRPFNLGPNVNSERWESQPSITAGKDRLYFISNRPGPNGDKNFDIWYCDYDWDMEEFKPAENLTEINTAKTEFSPFIGADGVTLFFASDGYSPNVGGLDFYVTRLDPETKEWSKPQNLGEPINTDENEAFISLPAGGDVIYFSSKRKDLEGYQGDYDLFMAFVPTFFKTKIVKITVIDECSQALIPAEITIKNPLTDKTSKDSVHQYRNEAEIIISNKDYGPPQDNNQFINLNVTAKNDKYGETTEIVQVTRPKTTDKADEAGKTEDEIYVTLTMGKTPVLDTEIDESEHVRTHKEDNPEIAGFRGLVMKGVKTWDVFPLLNYVFFDFGSAKIPDRYVLYDSPEKKRYFSDTTIPGGTLNKYYNLLNVYGFRMNKHPDTKITLVGCIDGTADAEKDKELSKKRAQAVYDYFKDVWGISEDRMKIRTRLKPKVVSNIDDSLGIQENRRVEILSDDWEIRKPVFDIEPTTFPQPDKMKFVLNNGIADMLVAKRRIEINRGGKEWATLKEVGVTDKHKQWDWYSKDGVLPKDEVPFKARLVITTKTDKECKSPEIEIPVMQAMEENRKIGIGEDSTRERYILILFPFDRANSRELYDRIMQNYVFNRIYPISRIDIIGHTDVVGLYEHNQRLSDRRANTVYKGIRRKTRGKYAELIKRGVGEDEPLYDNSLPEGRFYNRTVQVTIKTPLSQFEK